MKGWSWKCSTYIHCILLHYINMMQHKNRWWTTICFCPWKEIDSGKIEDENKKILTKDNQGIKSAGLLLKPLPPNAPYYFFLPKSKWEATLNSLGGKWLYEAAKKGRAPGKKITSQSIFEARCLSLEQIVVAVANNNIAMMALIQN